MKKILIVVFLLFSQCLLKSIKAQLSQKENLKIDSLKKVIQLSKHDTTTINMLIEWDNLIYIANPHLDLKLNQKIDSLCNVNLNYRTISKKEKKAFLSARIISLNNLGSIYTNKGEYTRALSYLNNCLKIQTNVKDDKKKANCLNNLGIVYWKIGDYPKAIYYYTKSLKLQEKVGNLIGVSATLHNIGLIYKDQEDYHKAIEYLSRSLKIDKKIGNNESLGTTYNSLGLLYSDQKKYDIAMMFYLKSLKIMTESSNFNSMANVLSNIGIIFSNQQDYDEAFKYFEKSLHYREKVSNKQGIANSLNNLGVVYFRKGNYQKSIILSEKALAIAKEIGSLSEIKNASQTLWKSYKELGRFKSGLNMFELYISSRDSISSLDNKKEIINQEYKYKYEKQTSIDSIKNSEEKKITYAKIEKQKIEIRSKKNQQYLLFTILVLIIIFVGFLYNRFKHTNKQKKTIELAHSELENKNREILDSITYAKRIQSAILPQPKLVKQFLEDSFILYKPKDIVAGDFYWLEVVGDTVLFAAADCTGHGVPGAMVSVVCNNGLNRAVREFGLSNPNEILDKTRELVIQEFEKSDEDVKDGMDISLCALDVKTNILKWSGANNPLWVLRNKEILEYKADKQPIGKHSDAKPFTSIELQLEKNDIIHIFTDGYQDQFGGPRQKKYRVSQMRELFMSIFDKPMEEQRKLIDASFESWKGELEQVDDVCVIGVRV